MTLKPCPFCGNQSADYPLEPVREPFYDTKGIKCNNCGAVGPMAVGNYSAATMWNHRTEPKEDIHAN